MLGLALVVLVSQKPVDLPPRAMRLDALLKELSSATGETHRASGPMAGRIVMVAGPPRPTEALRTDIASATWGKWRRVGSDWNIDEDRAAVEFREKQRLASRIAQAKQAQEAMRAAAKPFDEAAAKALLFSLDAFDKAQKERSKDESTFRRRVQDAAPANAAVRRIVASIDPVELAKLELGQAVYSDRPTRLQRPLSSKAAGEIRQLERDQSVWAGIYSDNSAWQEAHRSTGWMSMDPRGYTEFAPSGSLRLLLRVRALAHGQTMFSGIFVDRAGKRRQFGEVSINFRDEDQREDPRPAVVPGEPKLPLTPEAQALSDHRRSKPYDPALKTLLLHPERREPLDILVGEGIRGIAKARNQGVVAWLGDDAMIYSAGEGKSAGDWLRDLWLMRYEVLPADGRILIRPRFHAVNVDRPSLAGLMTLAYAKGYLPLDDIAEYAAKTPSRKVNGDTLMQVSLNAVLPGAMSAVRTDWKMLSLWGSFSRAQRQTLMRPGLVPWGQVSPTQRDRLIDAVLNAGSNDIRATGTGSANVLEREPTEVLAGGLNFGDGIAGSGSTYEGVFALNTSDVNDSAWSGGLASYWSLAQAVVARERRPSDEHSDGLPRTLPSVFLPGRILNFGLSIPLSPTLAWQKSATFGEFNLLAKPQPIEAMSDGFRKQYEEALERIRNQPPNG